MYITVNEYLQGKWPAFLPRWPDPTVFDQVWIEPMEMSVGDQATLVARLLFERELAVPLPGLDQIDLLLAPKSRGTEIAIEVDIAPAVQLRLLKVPVMLRFGPKLLRPLRPLPGGGYEPDPTLQTVEIRLGEVGVAFNGDGTLEFTGGVQWDLPVPVQIVGTEIVIRNGTVAFDLQNKSQCLQVTWQEADMGSWLSGVSPVLGGAGAPAAAKVSATIIWDESVREVRLDWQFGAASDGFTWSLPGVQIQTPAAAKFSLVCGGQRVESAGQPPTPRPLHEVALTLQLPADNSADDIFTDKDAIRIRTTFAWNRDDERELHNDEDKVGEPLFAAGLRPRKDVALTLLEFNLRAPGLPRFLQQLDAALFQATPGAEDACQLSVLATERLQKDNWQGKVKFNLPDFTMPFLKDGGGGDNAFGQWLQVKAPTGQDMFDIDFDKSLISLALDVTLKFGSIQFNGDIAVQFNWETMSVTVDHESGLKMLATQDELASQEHLGLVWRLKGKKLTDDGKTKYHYFTLVTKNHNYQIQMAQGAALELDYTKISKEPITFIVSNFVLGPKGIDLSAEVSDRPARLNGVNTRFTFHGSSLTIKENRIQDFTLAGSGPLPPDLVGEAMVDIGLQFAQRDGKLTLVQGKAELQGKRLLDCKGTRFRFTVDAIGLEFVYETAFHLYFTLTGSAQFVLASGDDRQGALALLPKIKMDLVKCPLCGDPSVIAKHIQFLIEMPKPISFNFLGAFEFELRAIGFFPVSDIFDDKPPAMQITGQLRFAQGAGDVKDPRPDYHKLFIALPRPGGMFPRLHFKQIAVNLTIGEAFKLQGIVEFKDEATEKGFLGEGSVELQGMPSIAAAFAFLRVRRDEQSAWVRAWFVYLEVRRLSVMIPVIQIYIREVGMGFGYRYTIASIKVADRENDVKKLIASLNDLSRTQGDLARRDRWEVDLENANESPRWTIVLRALFAQSSASALVNYEEQAEKTLPCVFLFDVMIAFRSDLTFYMAARGWLNTNYYTYDKNTDGAKEKPLVSGFILLSPRRKRFLAHVSTNKDAYIGDTPPLPDVLKKALTSVRFSATLLIEPGLMHYELGWPNNIGWEYKLGPLAVSISCGFIFRISRRDLIIGISFKASGSVDIKAELDLGLVGVRVHAYAYAAFGARLITKLPFSKPLDMRLYGAIGLELRIEISIELFIRIPLIFTTIKLTFKLSLGIGFTAGLEVSLGLRADNWGVRGSGTLFIMAIGHRLEVSAKFSANGNAVTGAKEMASDVLGMGLEAAEIEGIPGVDAGPARAPIAAPAHAGPLPAAERAVFAAAERAEAEAEVAVFEQPDYTAFVVRSDKTDGWSYFVLLPAGEHKEADGMYTPEVGFLPPPPLTLRVREVTPGSFADDLGQGRAPDAVIEALQKAGLIVDDPLPMTLADAASQHYTFTVEGSTLHLQLAEEGHWAIRLEVEDDFWLNLPGLGAGESSSRQPFVMEQYKPLAGGWKPVLTGDSAASGAEVDWKVNWVAPILPGVKQYEVANEQLHNEQEKTFTLAEYLAYAYELAPIKDPSNSALAAQPVPVRDPKLQAVAKAVIDDRVQNPSDNSYEAAVRGALEQFAGSPYFKHDPKHVLYDQMLQEAFDDDTSIYTPNGRVPVEGISQDMREQQQARQLRGMVIQDIIAALQAYAVQASAAPEAEITVADQIPFQMGLVFRYRNGRPAWLDGLDDKAAAPTIRQRQKPVSSTAKDLPPQRAVRTFNTLSTDFTANPPRFQRVHQYTSASTIALAWDLEWQRPLAASNSPAQQSPEHHLAHYMVRRRALDGSERDVVYTTKPAHAAHLRAADDCGPQGLLLLQARFQVADHFTYETPADRALLPASGRSYLYTITPVDMAGKPGQPLTLVATRYPDEAPPVPLNGEVTATYAVDASTLVPAPLEESAQPQAVLPRRVHVEWDDSAAGQANAHVPVRDYLLILRRDRTLPIGSYGLDSASQRPSAQLLPTSNARPLASDIKIALTVDTDPITRRRSADILPELLAQGVLGPADAPLWRPESWRVFLQTVSANGVPSSLAPVELHVRAEAAAAVGQPAAVEERAVAEMEWLARPLRLPLLPPEDQRAIPGTAHFPMPECGQYTFDPTLGNVSYHRHPAEIRCVRLRWNQGPSGAGGYPLDLNAGYHLLHLDIDAVPDEAYATADALSASLRPLQEVQMLPAADLLLQPSNTLSSGQWEAWYPSAIQRRRKDSDMARQRSQQRSGPWYSWRESRLLWPPCPDAFVDPATSVRKADLHPFLARLITRLDTGTGIGPGAGAGAQGGLIVISQPPPAMQPGTWPMLVENTNAKNDPYGWAILQRLGLTTAFSLRDEQTGELLTGSELLAAVQEALAALAAERDPDNPDQLHFATYYRHLFVELLFQPGKSISLDKANADADSLLALVQVSLRPVAEQYLKYFRINVTGAPWGEVEVEIELEAKQQMELVHAGDPNSAVLTLEGVVTEQPTPHSPPPTAIRLPVQLTADGELALALRGERGPRAVNIYVRLPAVPQPEPPTKLPGFDWLRYVHAAGTLPYIIVSATDKPQKLSPAQVTALRTMLQAASGPTANTRAIDTLFSLHVQQWHSFAPTDELAARFPAPQERMAEEFAAKGQKSMGASEAQWLRFRRYVLALNDPEAGQQIELSTSAAEIAKLLPGFLEWSQRFFDHGPDVRFGEDGLGVVGPQGTKEAPLWWMATAYPRASSPAYAAPDEHGRLQYDHLFADRWAHNYRFYIRPYGRYDLIWRSFADSPQLFPEGVPAEVQNDLKPAQPDPLAGGLDVVLDRTQPIEAPLILSSTRLDKPAQPGQPVPPGKIWEVIIAQHTEQAIVERNQTLARQLAYRHVAFTLLRRLTRDGWDEEVEGLVNNWNHAGTYTLPMKAVSQETPPPIPSSYPAQPDHISLGNGAGSAGVDEDDARSLALPARIGVFQQGALALQWQDLPFYYTHRLLVVAQTANTVSPVNRVEQSNFEYRTPQPLGRVSGQRGQGSGTVPALRFRQVAIPLCSFWESLPPGAQDSWPDERPDAPGSTANKRKFSSLPDPDVVYQIVEQFSGNSEVQVEFFYDAKVSNYAVRQLGKRYLGQIVGLLAPPTAPPSPPDGRSLHDPFVLLTAINQKPETGAGPDAPNTTEYSEEAVSRNLSANLLVLFPGQDNLASTEGQAVKLVWTGAMTEAEKAAVLAVPGEQAFTRCLADLAAAVQAKSAPAPDEATAVLAPLELEPIPAALTDANLPVVQTNRLALQRAADGKSYTALAWQGMLIDDELADFEAAVAGWTQTPEVLAALDQVRTQLDERALSAPLPAATGGRPMQEDLFEAIREQLLIGAEALTWQGRLHSKEQHGALKTLAANTNYDAGFLEAVGALIAQLAQTPITVELSPAVPLRPTQEELPGALADKLLLGSWRLRCRGLMTAAEGQALLGLFANSGADRRAIERLYAATLQQGLAGRRLLIRARRGNAAPSAPMALAVEPLADADAV